MGFLTWRTVLAMSLLMAGCWASAGSLAYAQGLDTVNEARSVAGLPPLMDAAANNPAQIVQACRYNFQLLSQECGRGMSQSCTLGLQVKQACRRAMAYVRPTHPVMPMMPNTNVPTPKPYSNPDAAAGYCYGACSWHYATHECICK